MVLHIPLIQLFLVVYLNFLFLLVRFQLILQGFILILFLHHHFMVLHISLIQLFLVVYLNFLFLLVRFQLILQECQSLL